MDWSRFQTRNEASDEAFEALCNQLFKRWCYSTNPNQIAYFNVTEGSGGDGGVESYAKLNNGDFVGLQAKWFRDPITSKELGQIRKSIITAKKVRPSIKQYIICVPRKVSDQTARTNRSGRPQKSERERWAAFEEEINKKFPDTALILWSEDVLHEQLLLPGAEGVRKYWFENEEISISSLRTRFELAENGWLKERYVPSLHGSGRISQRIDIQLGDPQERLRSKWKLLEFDRKITDGLHHIDQFLRAYSNKKPSKIKITAGNCYMPSETLLESLKNLKKDLMGTHDEIVQLCEHLNYGTSTAVGEVRDYIDLDSIVKGLRQERPNIEFSFLHHDLGVSLEEIPLNEINYYLESIPEDLLPYNLIFSGDPGTGKTHGLAHKVNDRLKNDCPAVLVRAKNAPITQGWGAVLKQELGLSDTWDEDEIWSALEACASRSDVIRAQSSINDAKAIGCESTKVLICIDGLDESKERTTWLEKIGELKVIIKDHPELRFCISGRPYVFEGDQFATKTDPYDSDRESIEKNGYITVVVPSRGDVSADELFYKYIRYYQIDTFHAPWVRWTLSTPLALKLFCEIYAGKTLGSSEKVLTTVSSLLSEKIRRIDDELRIKCEEQWGKSDNVVLRSLIAFSDYFLHNREITRSDACRLISSAPRLESLIDNSTSQKILDYLRDYGLLLECTPINTDPLRPEEPTYQFAFEPLNDYLIAENAVRTIRKSGSSNLPPGLKGKPAAQSWAALILLSDHKILVGEDNFWADDLPEEVIDKLRLFSLSQVNREDLGKFKPWVEAKIRKSMPTCRKFIGDLIVKVARIDNHPLGPKFLHEVLLSFENVATRDLVFSGPDFLLSNSDAVWAGWSQNPIDNEKLIYSDLDSDLASGMPLLFAWTLTSVDEKLRHTCRKELTRWGKKNPQEFLKLLQLAFQSNDPQMREEIVQVSSAIACLLDPNDKILKNFAEWTLDEIFRSEKIGVIRDIVIRQAGRIICERAFLGGHISLKQLNTARPPFSITSSQYPIDRNAILKNEEYPFPISWDLAEYVLAKAYEGFFKEVRNKGQVQTQAESEWSNVSRDTIQEILSGKFGRVSITKRRELEAIFEEERLRKEAFSKVQIRIVDATLEDASESTRSKPKKEIRYSKNAEKLLKKYSDIHGVKDLSPRQLTTAACLYYLNKMGWNKEEFYGEPNGGETGEILGADVAIIRKYGPASHGERSSVSSFAEKYVWCFVHEFIGYLADTLEYSEDHPEKSYFVSDYSHIYNLPSNPAQELHEVKLDLNSEDCDFFLPNNVAPEMKFRGRNRLNNLKRWITGAPIPDLSPWILPTKEHLNQMNCFCNYPWLTLRLYASITEPTVQGNSLFWINSFIINNEDFKLFKRDCSLKATHTTSFVERSIDSYGHIKTAATYLTPFDVLWMPWKEEYLEDTQVSFQNNRQKQYRTYHTTIEGYYRSAINGEQSYALPSKTIREFLEICKGDVLKYYSQEDSLKGFFFESGTRWRDGQKMIFVQRDELLRKLKEKNYSIFWTIRLSRRSSMHALEEFPNMRLEKDLHWVFWLEGTRTKLLEISQSPKRRCVFLQFPRRRDRRRLLQRGTRVLCPGPAPRVKRKAAQGG